MTGRDLIIYILQNNLEDEEIFKDGKLMGFSTIEEAAIKLRTTAATIEALFKIGKLPGFTIGDNIYIFVKE